MKFGEDLFNNELRPAPSRSCYQPFSAEFHNGAFRERPLCADFVAELGIPTARDGWCIFLKPSIVTRWIVLATYAGLY